jgi:hypothetical protein
VIRILEAIRMDQKNKNQIFWKVGKGVAGTAISGSNDKIRHCQSDKIRRFDCSAASASTPISRFDHQSDGSDEAVDKSASLFQHFEFRIREP